MSVLDTQCGGSHYAKQKIQPIEYIYANGMDFIPANIVKYATRFRHKGKAQDIEKIVHYAKLLLQLEYGYTDEQLDIL